MKHLFIYVLTIVLLVSCGDSLESRTEKFLKDPVKNSEVLTMDEWKEQAYKFVNNYLPQYDFLDYQRDIMRMMIDNAYNEFRKFNWKTEFESFTACNRDTIKDKDYIGRYVGAMEMINFFYPAVYRYYNEMIKSGYGLDFEEVRPSTVEMDKAIAYINDLENNDIEIPYIDIFIGGNKDALKQMSHRGSFNNLVASSFMSFPEVTAGLYDSYFPWIVSIKDKGNEKYEVFFLSTLETKTIDGSNEPLFLNNHVVKPEFEGIY